MDAVRSSSKSVWDSLDCRSQRWMIPYIWEGGEGRRGEGGGDGASLLLGLVHKTYPCSELQVRVIFWAFT